MDGRPHHLLFTRTSWESSVATRKLRQLPNFIIPMHEEVEEILHKHVTTVPLLDQYTARHAYREFVPQTSYIGSIYGLMTAIEAGTRHPKATQIQKRLGELTVHAIELQVPYIREGMTATRVGGRE